MTGLNDLNAYVNVKVYKGEVTEKTLKNVDLLIITDVYN